MHRCFKWCWEDTARCSDKTSLMKHLRSSLLFIMQYTSAAFSFALPGGRKVVLIRVYCKYAVFLEVFSDICLCGLPCSVTESLFKLEPASCTPPSCLYSCRCLLQGLCPMFSFLLCRCLSFRIPLGKKKTDW